ncbi:DNA-binding protein [Lysobacter sp. MMG2]|uniref:DNA-binding protein n=1 Tax=Lysobacter sp. MMG2 TaxID=2801338 RepID=UPI001C225F80|nr:DNA-binding protein [Lysobacter sp. MMG2]MBU8974515.1 DNA-binding protein [Lysobacter sp. MMG2]
MARGITESGVHGAADALVAVGERPTVERVRAYLGTGSPNTVTRWLETWWQTLGARLTAQAAKVALPAAPDAVVALAAQWWELALTAARVEAERAIAEERARLDKARTELDEQTLGWQAQIQQHVAIAEEAQQQLATADQRLSDVQRTCDVQAEQLRDLGAQRDAAHLRAERVDAELAGLQARVIEREEAITRERDAQVLHVRAVENRTHAEVDRARQEIRQLRGQLATQERDHAAERQELQHEHTVLRTATTEAQREAAAQRARADAFEAHFAQLGSLSTTLQAALLQASTAPPPTRRKAGATRRRP